MSEINPPFKRPSKKHEPKGLNILFEDKYILVVRKASGLLTIGTDKEKTKTAHYLLSNYVKKGNPKSKARIFIVHRLDRDTSGVLVFAKDEKTKRNLQDNWQSYSKKYLAVVNGKMDEQEGYFSSLLAENKVHFVYSTLDENEGKMAKTGYKVLKEAKDCSLLDIKLFSGRKHQIRVHLADAGHPVVGDKVYGNKTLKYSIRLALHAYSLTITHPVNRKEMTFEISMPNYFKELLKE